jgi:hypothetical protein
LRNENRVSQIQKNKAEGSEKSFTAVQKQRNSSKKCLEAPIPEKSRTIKQMEFLNSLAHDFDESECKNLPDSEDIDEINFPKQVIRPKIEKMTYF